MDMVSTHAPVRARLEYECPSCKGTGRFNSRAREGATLSRANSAIDSSSFNSRAREGATILSLKVSVCRHCFNSRAREGATR